MAWWAWVACGADPVVSPDAAGRELVAVAGADLARGRQLEASDVVWAWVPGPFVPAGALGPTAPIVGRILAGAVPAHEPLRAERFAAVPAGRPVPPAGMRLAPDREREAGDTVTVVVAARDLLPGVRIDQADLEVRTVPPDFLHEGVFLDPKHVVGRVVCARTFPGESIHFRRVSDGDPERCPSR